MAGNQSHVVADPGASVKMEPQQVSVGVAAPPIKAQAPAAGTGPPEKKKKKKRDKDGRTDETKPSNAGNGFQPAVKAETKEGGTPGIQSAGRKEPGMKKIAEKDALGKAGGSKKLAARVHNGLPNGHAEHQAGHASAEGKVKKTKDKLKE